MGRVYMCELPIGILSIRSHRTVPGKVELWFHGQCLGAYESPVEAAADVGAYRTGFEDIDRYVGNVPKDLGEWEAISF
jgi:hypothetical protein